MSSQSVATEGVPKPNPLIPAGAWAADLGKHPCLLGPAWHLRELAARWPDEYREIRTLPPEGWMDGIGHAHAWDPLLLARGVIHAVEGGIDERTARTYIDKALGFARAGASNIHQDTWVRMQQAVLAYDFFHEFVAPGEGRAIIDWLNSHLGVFNDDENPFHNSTLSKSLCYLEVAYGTWAANPRAREFRDYALVKLYEGQLLPVLREFGAGGGYTECGWYTRHCLWHLAKALEMARRFEGYDGFAKAPAFFHNRMAYELLQPYPGLWERQCERYAPEGDAQTWYTEFLEFPRMLRNLLAQYWRGSDLARFTAAKDRRGSSPHVRMCDFVYRQPSEDPLPLAQFPAAHAALGVGKVYARGSWDDDATWLRFECGDYFNQHQHFEAGNFEIFRREPLAAESGIYCDWSGPHSLNWLIRTIAHNCILIHDGSEKFNHRNRNRDRIVMANDGGQGADSYIVQSLDEWKRVADQGLRRGRIVAYENRPEFMHVAGDSTAGYGPKARRVLRQIVFIRPHTFVMLDRVESARPEFAKAWLMHCRNEPAIDGAIFTVVDGRGKLTVRTLLPSPANIARLEDYAYGGHRYDPSRKVPMDVSARWRVEVRPVEARRDDIFLHVLSTEDAPLPAELARDGQAVGAKTADWQVMFDPAGSVRTSIGGKVFTSEFALKPGKYER